MALRIPWDKYETALLIETYLQIESGITPRVEAIRVLPEKLRKRAVENGIEIDEIYRNENGISMQLGYIQKLMRHRPDAHKHNTKIFVEMVKLYDTNRAKFNAILAEAKGEKAPVKTNKELFFEWLTGKIPSSQIKECYLMMSDIESFARKKNIFIGSIWDVKDPVITKQLLDAIEHDVIFRLLRMRMIRQLIELTELYHEYTSEKSIELIMLLSNDNRSASNSDPNQDINAGITADSIISESIRAGEGAVSFDGVTALYHDAAEVAEANETVMSDETAAVKPVVEEDSEANEVVSFDGAENISSDDADAAKRVVVEDFEANKAVPFDGAEAISSDDVAALKPEVEEATEANNAASSDEVAATKPVAVEMTEANEAVEILEVNETVMSDDAASSNPEAVEESEANEPDSFDGASTSKPGVIEVVEATGAVSVVDNKEERNTSENTEDSTQTVFNKDTLIQSQSQDRFQTHNQEQEISSCQNQSTEQVQIRDMTMSIISTDAIKKNHTYQNVDFDRNKNYKNTKPISVVFLQYEADVSSWEEAYHTACSFLYAEHPNAFTALKLSKLSHGESIVCSTGVESEKLAYGVYLPSQSNPNIIVQYLKQIMDTCHIDYTDLSISYIKEKGFAQVENADVDQISTKDANTERRADESEETVLKDVYHDNRKDTVSTQSDNAQNKNTNTTRLSFVEWLRSKHFSSLVAHKHADSIIDSDAFLVKQGLTSDSLYELDAEEIRRIYEILSSDKYYRSSNRANRSTTLNLYAIQLLVSYVENKKKESNNNQAIILEVNPKSVVQEQGMSTLSYLSSDPHIQKADKVLPDTGNASDGEEQKRFELWIQNRKKLSGPIAKEHADSIIDTSKFLIRKKLIDKTLYEVHSIDDLTRIKHILRSNRDYPLSVRSGRSVNQNLKALDYLIEYNTINYKQSDLLAKSTGSKNAQTSSRTDNTSRRNAFVDWLIILSVPATEAKRIASVMEEIGCVLRDNNLIEQDIFEIRDPDEIDRIQNKLLFDPQYISVANSVNGFYQHIDSWNFLKEFNLRRDSRSKMSIRDAENRVPIPSPIISKSADDKSGSQTTAKVKPTTTVPNPPIPNTVLSADSFDSIKGKIPSDIVQALFEAWLINRKHLTRVASKAHAESIISTSNYLKEKERIRSSLYDVHDLSRLRKIYVELKRDRDFVFHVSSKRSIQQELDAVKYLIDFFSLTKQERLAYFEFVHPAMNSEEHTSKDVTREKMECKSAPEQKPVSKPAPQQKPESKSTPQQKPVSEAVPQDKSVNRLTPIDNGKRPVSGIKPHTESLVSTQQMPGSIRSELGGNSDSLSSSGIIRKEAFIQYLSRRGYAKGSCKGYASAIASIDRFTFSHHLLEQSIFDISSYTLLEATWDMLQATKAFADYDRRQNRRFATAMKQYLPFARKQLLMESSGTQKADQPKPVTQPKALTGSQREQTPIKKSESTQAPSVVSRPLERTKQGKAITQRHPGRQEFETWLKETGCPGGTIQTYTDSVERISSFLLEHGLEDRPLFSIRGVARLQSIRVALRNNQEFSEQSKSNRGVHLELYALKKYIDFRTGDADDQTDDVLSDQLSKLLQECFSNGFRLNSIIDRNRLKQFYEGRFGTAMDLDDQQILDRIKTIGTVQDNRVFYHEGSDHSDLIDDIQAELAFTFNQGASCIYYTELFQRHQDALAAQVQVYNPDTLKNLLVESSYGEYLPGRFYFYRKSRSADADSDIRSAMRASTLPLTYEQLQERLWYLPQDRIKRCLLQSSDLVNVDKNTYFDARNLPVNDQELLQITRLIHRQLAQKDFLTDAELRDIIRRDCPSVAINTEDFTTWGLRNCLAVLLSGQFSFNGPIVSEIGRELNMGQAFAQFSQSHELMTLDELKQFAKEVNKSIIYWDSVMEVMVRISQDEFIPKTSIEFDVDAIDHVLDELFEGEYAPLKSLDLFFQYPAISVKWNSFVLESYIAGFSRKFDLLHSSYTMSECCGAVVRKESNIKDFQALVTDVLVHDGQWHSKNDALTLLVREGYLQRKNYAKIDTILPEAKLLREKNATGM